MPSNSVTIVSPLYRTSESSHPHFAHSLKSQTRHHLQIIIRSFYLEPVYRLVPKFNPFLMATLLVSSFGPSLPGNTVLARKAEYSSPDFQDRCPLCLSFSRLCHTQRAFGNAPIRAVSDRAQSHGWCDHLLVSPTPSLFFFWLTVMTMTFFFNVTDTGKKIVSDISFAFRWEMTST